MAQRDIPRKIPRQATKNNRIADKAAEASLAPRFHVTVDQRACCSTAALDEGGFGLQHGNEEETDRRNSQSSELRKHSNAVPLNPQDTGRVKLAWIENHHVGSSEANSSSGDESLALCGDLNTQQQGTVEIHPIPKTMTLRRETTKL